MTGGTLQTQTPRNPARLMYTVLGQAHLLSWDGAISIAKTVTQAVQQQGTAQ